jgi:2,4-dienoyl-CoA reductase-like NADH-dependent reductase (Old Yellow Enzyme family)/NADPH-dependent 2,4-dienoyl-CoA reductase/sulfur reductase-like enzyme
VPPIAEHYRHLLSPGRIGTMELRNRIVHAPMSLGLGAGDGTCGERYVAYYAERAKGGAGLINIGTVSVGYPEGSVDAKQIAASDDKFLPSLKGLADAIHAHGAKTVLQLNHNGIQAGSDRAAGRPLATPSLPVVKPGDLADKFLPEELAALAAGNPVLGEVQYQVLDTAGIHRIVAMFADAARRCQRAGVDAVEIHGGHGYLLAAFLSPVTNHRTDAYGGPVENRARFLVEVLRAVRAAVGPDFPVWCKIDSAEFELAGGISLDDAKATARMAEAAGADAISVSAYSDVSKAITHSGSHTPQQPELLVPNASAIKVVVNVPVITAGRIEAVAADRHIAEGHFDFVAFGRKLLADPDLPRKLSEGRPQDVRPCIYCYSCISQAYFRRPVTCTVNPEMGLEYARAPSAASPKRVAVVGGGPAGMEAALRLRAKGHEPILIERSDGLGGTFAAAAITYEPNERYLNWLRREIAAAGLDVRLGTPATPEMLASLKADSVVVATGAAHKASAIPGIDKACVIRVQDYLRTRPSGRAIAIIGGDIAGLELAEWLQGNGKMVSVISAAAKLGAGLPIVRRARLLAELRQKSVMLIAGARDIAIGEGEVTWRNAGDGIGRATADRVIVTIGAVANLGLVQKLSAAGFAVSAVGDCTGVLYLESAIRAVADLVDRI